MQVGLLLGSVLPAPALGALAAECEALGFDSLWVGDHVAFPAPILDPLQVLACFAAHTRRVRLGTCVYLLALRQPTVVAKMVASLDVVSAGRLIFGVGVGGEFPGEFAACGVPVKERGRRTDEALTVLRGLWRGEEVEHVGRFFPIPPVRLAPPPAQSGGPPIWIGGRADAALRRAARAGDGYVGHFLTPEGFHERIERIRALAREQRPAAPPPTAAHLAFALVDSDHGAALSRAGAMLGAIYGRPMEAAAARYCVAGTAGACRSAVERYAAAGVEHLILSPLAYGDALAAQITALASMLGRADQSAHHPPRIG
jgi:probable F420-dependent oxidoreductase